MQLKTAEECRTYVDAELRTLTHAQRGWHSAPSTDVPNRPLTWTVSRGVGEGWHTLEARLDRSEFLIWFGNHQVGVPGLHWIMRPAVHVAFEDLAPRGDTVALRFSLGDILAQMIYTLSLPMQHVTCFALNSYSHT